jgi:enterochelin esterase family protein
MTSIRLSVPAVVLATAGALIFACSPSAPVKPQQPPQPTAAVRPIAAAVIAASEPATRPIASTRRTTALAATAAQSILRSPEISGDHRITFRVAVPRETRSVQVIMMQIGGATTMPMTRAGSGSDGTWSLTTPPLSPDVYEYTFRADGVRFLDPSDPWIKDRNWSLVKIAGSPPMPWDDQRVPHGVVRRHNYESATLGGVPRRLHVYTPPGYDDPANAAVPYPVFYLLHGSGDDDSGWTNCGRANVIFDNLIAAGRMRPMIVAMPYGHVPRYDPTTAPSSAALVPITMPTTRSAPDPDYIRLFERELLAEVVPLVEGNYRVIADQPHRAIGGLSMGGSQALRIGLANLDTFAWITTLSAGRLRSEDVASDLPELDRHPAAANEKLRLLWMACGSEDKLLKYNQDNDQWLTSHGIRHEFQITPGANHTWPLWRRYLVEAAGRLFRQ